MNAPADPEVPLSTLVSVERRIWLPLVAAGLALALSAGLFSFVVLSRASTGGKTRPEAAAPTVPELEQAPWKINRAHAGAVGKVGKAQRARVAHQAPRVALLIREVYDALFLSPDRAKRVVAKHFTKRAGNAFLRSKVGLPKGAEEIQTLVRRARIRVAINGASQAVAQVRIRLRGRLKGDLLRLRNTSTLWLARSGNRWRVVAYELDQVPIL